MAGRWQQRLRHLGGSLAVIFCLLGGEAQAGEAPPVQFEAVPSLNAEASLAIIQDRQGFIWVGSSSGVYRHDGYRSVRYQYDSSNADSLPDDVAPALLEDSNGRIWVGTRNGLARFEPRTGGFTQFLPPPGVDGNQQNRITRALIGDGNDGLWLATRAGLLHLDPETRQFKSYRHDPTRADSLPGDNVAALARDANGGVWAGTWPTGLAYLAKGADRVRRYALDDAKDARRSPGNLRALLIDSRQRLWIGTETGIFLWSSGTPWETRRRLPSPPGLGEFRVSSIYEDPAGIIWVGTMEAGLLRWDETNHAFQRYTHDVNDAFSLPGNAVSTVFVDRTETLWVGTRGNGISRGDLANNGFEKVLPELIAPENFKAWNIVFSFAEDGRGNLWLGGTGGLALVNLAKRTLLRSIRHRPGKPGGLSSNAINHLYQQPDGPLWIATNDGLGRLDPASGRLHTRRFEGTGNNSINRIAPGKNGVLWLATAGGVIRYAPLSGVMDYFSQDPGDPDSLGLGSNSSLVEDRAGNLWVGGGHEAGARRLSILEKGSGKFRHYGHDPDDNTSLSNGIVSSIHEDNHGDLWIATSTGLNRAVRSADGRISFTRYATASPVWSVQADLDNNLWASTASGFLRINPETGETTNFKVSEGSSEGASIEGSAFRSHDGNLYFGSAQGFILVKPNKVRQNTTPPQVVITDISVFNQSLLNQPASPDIELSGSVTEPESLTLSWKSSFFALAFSALHYANPAHNSFSYRLDGFDKAWQETTAERRVATYSNLEPGEYRFRVKAASKNGIWSESELSLPITITPPFWTTPIFLIALLIFVVLLLVLIYNWRMRQLTRNQAHLEALVEERTRQLVDKERAKTRFLASASHDLRQPIQAITLFLGALKHTGLKDGQSDIVGQLDSSVEALRGLLNSLLDISKLDAGVITPLYLPFSLNRLMESLTLELSPLALDKNLRFKFFCPNREITLNTDAQLLKVALQNLISNAITYTDRGGLLFAARLKGKARQYVSIQIWDTGISISPHEQARIFDEFYQIGNPQRNRSKGLGLGLSIVKRTLALLDLPVTCRSRAGRGSVFETCIPVVAQAGSASKVNLPPAPLEFARFNGRRFVVVEDDSQAATGMKFWLQSIGGEVVTYASAESALADSGTIYGADYYVSDFRLPGKVSGLDFLQAIRVRTSAPCVLVTGDTSSEFIAASHHFAMPVLYKPIVLEQLLRTLSA